MKKVHLVTSKRDILLDLHEQVVWQDGEEVISTDVVEVQS